MRRTSNEDGTKQLGMLLSIPNELRDPAKDAIVLFGETPASEPDAIKAWVYPGERTGYEFIYPRSGRWPGEAVSHQGSVELRRQN